MLSKILSWTLFDIFEHSWTLLDTFGHSWTLLDHFGHLWTLMDIYLYKCNYLIKCLIKNQIKILPLDTYVSTEFKCLIKKRSKILSWTLLDTLGHL